MAALIDTDLLIDVERGGSSAGLDALLGDEEQAISVITVSELLHGTRPGSPAERTRRRAFVEGLLEEVEPTPITEPVARVHADVWAHLTDRGRIIGAHDLWIAATGLAHGYAVATANAREFRRVPGLRVLAARR